MWVAGSIAEGVDCNGYIRCMYIIRGAVNFIPISMIFLPNFLKGFYKFHVLVYVILQLTCVIRLTDASLLLYITLCWLQVFLLHPKAFNIYHTLGIPINAKDDRVVYLYIK
eukprot:GHVO01059525.1.p1 GENE.GHVO01059525.1~~GHVO01059525.1.p1  ORF type:complete len:111 (+),score=11.62 GHVO01059525.1:192-524(+)